MGKTVLITGASRGIGKATALRFAKAGYNLVITYHKNLGEAEKTSQEARSLGAAEVLVLELDLRDDLSIERAATKALQGFPSINILVNNAGGLWAGELEQQSFSDIASQLRVNLEGPIKLTSRLLPHITEAVINLGSTLSKRGKKRLVGYCASKFGIRGFTQALAAEQPNLRVLTVNPGLTATSMGNATGVSPDLVAEVVFAAAGHLSVTSGQDINVRDYLDHSMRGRATRFIKAKIRKIFRL